MTLEERLKPYVRELIDAAAGGDKLARSVITLHRMYVRCPGDPGAPALCECAFDEWLKSRNAKET